MRPISTLSLSSLASTLALSSAATNGFTYTSCNSAYDFLSLNPPFTQVSNSSSNSIEYCTSLCSSYTYAALYGSQCFCSPSTPPTPLSNQDIECNTPCPGNPSEICGGYHPEVARGSEWWSLYSKAPISSSSSGVAGSTTTVVVKVDPTWTSTVYSTVTGTIIECGSEVENCPRRTSTVVMTMKGNLTTMAVGTGSVSASAGVVATVNGTVKASATTALVSTSVSTLSAGTGTPTPTSVLFTGAASRPVGMGILGVISFVCLLGLF